MLIFLYIIYPHPNFKKILYIFSKLFFMTIDDDYLIKNKESTYQNESYMDYINKIINIKGPTGSIGPVGNPGTSGMPGKFDENKTYLLQFGDLVYMAKIVTQSNNCLRIKFLERTPEKFLKNFINGEVWIPHAELKIIDTLESDVVRILKINSIGVDNG